MDTKTIIHTLSIMDTSAAYNIVKHLALLPTWWGQLIPDAPPPPHTLGDANSNQLRLLVEIFLLIWLGNAEYVSLFYVGPSLALAVLIGIVLVSTFIRAICFIAEIIKLLRGTIPILGQKNCQQSHRELTR